MQTCASQLTLTFENVNVNWLAPFLVDRKWNPMDAAKFMKDFE
jgi:hypothetical protein